MPADFRLNRRAAALGIAAAAATCAAPTRSSAQTDSGPKLVLIRFGGGVRRRETIDAGGSWAPFLLNELAPQGALIPDLRIAQLDGVDTSHAEGTINLLTGRYLAYRDAGSAGLMRRLQPTAPTLFEAYRRAVGAPAHHAIMINGEDRPQEEFLSFGAHRHFGAAYRAETLSAYRFGRWSVAERLARGGLSDERAAALSERGLALAAEDPRGPDAPPPPPALGRFWARFAEDYGWDGRRAPRGDRLLTELALRALSELRPRLLMVNYQDPDYVHWGVASHYTRAIQIIDDGLRRIWAALRADPFYRDDVAMVVTPDCGRDANALMDVPFQHHFNSRSAHEVWALAVGRGVERGALIDRVHDQVELTASMAASLGVAVDGTEGRGVDGFLG